MHIVNVAYVRDLYDFLCDMRCEPSPGADIRAAAADYFRQHGTDDWFDWHAWIDKACDAGAVGVLTVDDEARLYRFLGHSERMLGWFEPLHQPGCRIEHPLRDFWALVDSL